MESLESLENGVLEWKDEVVIGKLEGHLRRR